MGEPNLETWRSDPRNQKKLRHGKRIDYEDDDEDEKNGAYVVTAPAKLATLPKNEMLTRKSACPQYIGH